MHIGTVATLDDAVPALNPTKRRKGKTAIRGRPGPGWSVTRLQIMNTRPGDAR